MLLCACAQRAHRGRAHRRVCVRAPVPVHSPAAGYNIIITLGVGMAKMTPSRGFCAELATSFVIIIASVYGLPVSSTQIIVGGEFGIGLCEVRRRGERNVLLHACHGA